MSRPCAVCRKTENAADETGTVVTLHAYRRDEWAELSDLPADIRALSRIPNPRIEMHAGCAAGHLTVSPELMQILVEKEVAAERIDEERAVVIMEKITEDYRARIADAAKKLGLKKGA